MVDKLGKEIEMEEKLKCSRKHGHDWGDRPG